MLIKNWLAGELCLLNTLAITAQEYVVASKHAPSRPVGANAYTNLCSFIPSKKMEMTISTESFSAERSFAFLCEYDESVYEYYDQPQPVMIKKTNKNGKLRNTSYTPDFLIETTTGICVVEVKPLNIVMKLIQREPKNWIKVSEDQYDYEPARKKFEELGIKFRVWVYLPEYRYEIANISIMLAVRSSKDIDIKLSSKVEALFKEEYYWTIKDLFVALDVPDYTGLIQLIDKKVIYADIKNSLLSEPSSCVVVGSLSLLSTAIKSNSNNKFSIVSSPNIKRSVIPNESDAKKIISRLNRIDANEKGRSVRRWKKKILESKGSSRFEALIDKTYESGNRTPRLNKKVIDFLNRYLTKVHGNKLGMSRYRSYIKYCVDSKLSHAEYDPVSFKTFLRYLGVIPNSFIKYQRGGRRSRNGVLAPTNPIDRNLKFQLPWQAAAIDEYLADIYLVFYTADGKPYVARPWLTAMIDLATTKILAITISFKNPSKRSVSKIIRECVRNHGKLPREILFDRGSNYTSKYTAELLAHLGVINTMRPAAYSRSGGEIEGLFGEFIKQWLCQRPGNLADYKEARSVDGGMAPKNKAILKPCEFRRELEAFTNWRDAKPVGFGSEARIDKFNSGSSQFPFIAIETPYDEKLLITTAVDVNKYTIDPQRGIHIGSLFYWASELSNISQTSKKVEVRIDPENPHVIYSLINNIWVSCYTSHINRYSSLDFESQFVEGLIALETNPLKSKLKFEADKNLINIIESLDRPINSKEQVECKGKTKINPGPDDTVINIFDRVKKMKTKTKV